MAARWIIVGLLLSASGLFAQPKPVETAKLLAGERTLASYHNAGVPFKPYIQELFTPGGIDVILDAPSDHLHHHGVMFAISVDGVDFWTETPKCGKQIPRSFEVKDGRAASMLDWKSVDGKALLIERREVAAHKVDGVTLLSWTSELETPPGVNEAKLAGAHYFGLGMRFPRSMDKAGTFLLGEEAKGETVRGDEQVRPAAWVAAQGKIDDKPVTVALFDSPGNPRHPNRVFTMTDPFSYQSITLNLWKDPMTLAAGKSLKLKYGIAAWDGHVDKETVQRIYDKWTGR